MSWSDRSSVNTSSTAMLIPVPIVWKHVRRDNVQQKQGSSICV